MGVWVGIGVHISCSACVGVWVGIGVHISCRACVGVWVGIGVHVQLRLHGCGLCSGHSAFLT